MPFALAQENKENKPRKTASRWIASEKHGLKMRVPEGWQKIQNPGVVLAAKGAAGDAGTVGLNVRSVPGLTHSEINRKGFAEQMRGVALKLEGYAFVGDGKVEIAGGPGVWLHGTRSGIYLMQYIFAGEAQGFVATFNYPAEGAEKHAKLIAAIVDSIEIGADKGGARVVKGRVQAAHGFSLQMPKGWKLDTVSAGAFLAMAGPNKMSINARVEASLTSPPDPKAIVTEIEPALKKVLGESYQIRYSRSVRIHKRAAVWVEARYVQKGRKMRNLQLFVPGKKHGFILTFIAPASDFSKNIGKIKKAIRSIRID